MSSSADRKILRNSLKYLNRPIYYLVHKVLEMQTTSAKHIASNLSTAAELFHCGTPNFALMGESNGTNLEPQTIAAKKDSDWYQPQVLRP